MISVILIAEQSDAAAVETLGTLVEAVADGVLRDATLIGPSSDALDRVADAAGAARIVLSASRNEMVRRAAQTAKSDWLLIVTAGCVPVGEWINALAEFPADAAMDGAGFLPLQAKLGMGALLSAVLTNIQARVWGRTDPRHGILIRKAQALGGMNVKLTQLGGGMIDRRR